MCREEERAVASGPDKFVPRVETLGVMERLVLGGVFQDVVSLCSPDPEFIL